MTRQRRACRRASYRPRLEIFEDRIVPSGSDFFADASVLIGSPVSTTGSNVGATGEPGETDVVGNAEPINSVWWQWTAPEDGDVSIDTMGSDFDTTLEVCTGSAVDAPGLLALNDNSGLVGGGSQVVFTATAGTNYHIGVDGFLDATGNISLNLR